MFARLSAHPLATSLPVHQLAFKITRCSETPHRRHGLHTSAKKMGMISSARVPRAASMRCCQSSSPPIPQRDQHTSHTCHFPPVHGPPTWRLGMNQPPSHNQELFLPQHNFLLLRISCWAPRHHFPDHCTCTTQHRSLLLETHVAQGASNAKSL